MTTANKLLTCTACNEVFSNPVTLSCGHSFCGQCIVTSTEGSSDAVNSKSLLCPFCAKLTRVPDPKRPVEDWVGQIKPHLMLFGLQGTTDPNTTHITNCNLCEDEGETTPAVVWCSVCDVSLCTVCLKAHRRIPLTRNHDVSVIVQEVEVLENRKIMCQDHKEEIVTSFCQDCKKSACQQCCDLYHVKCKSVSTLKSMLPEMKASLTMQKKTLFMKLQDQERRISLLNTRCNNLLNTKLSVQSQIISSAQKATDAIKRQEQKLTNELNEVADTQMEQLKADIKKGRMAIQVYRQQSEFIDHALKSESEMDTFDLLQCGVVDDDSSTMDTNNYGIRSNITFNQDIEGLDKALKKLWNLQIIYEVVLDTESPPVHSYKIDCRNKEDRQEPSLDDIICMDVNGLETLVVTDSNNMCLKSLFKINNQQHRSLLRMQSAPVRIAKLEDNRLAATVPDSKQIVIVSATPDLKLISTISTKKKYWGLTAPSPTTFAAGSLSPPCVDILDRSGNVLQSFNPIHNGQKLVQNPGFLCTTRQGNVLVSDCKTKSVLSLSPNGEVVFNYSPTGKKVLQTPGGVVSTATGEIYVLDYTRHKVTQLSESGDLVRDVLTSHDGIIYPLGIECNQIGRIFVTHGKLFDANTVQVFTLK